MRTKHQPAPKRRWKIKPWDWPGDSPEDKAKRIALSYRQLALDITRGDIADPAGALDRLDQHWADRGQYWPRPTPITTDDDWHTAADLAHLIHKTPADIYRWARRKSIKQRVGPDGSPEYSLSSARTYVQTQRERRAHAVR